MSKVIGSIILLGLLLVLLVMTTPVTRLGSGFLIGDGRNVITYFDLVKEADIINIKFPNEDDIKAKLVYKNPAKKHVGKKTCPSRLTKAERSARSA